MKWRDFPWWAKALVCYSATLSIVNLLLMIQFNFGVANWKIDPGTATLVGAIIGFSIVAYQARVGFRNLIASQENQAHLEREARLHQSELVESQRKATEGAERKIVLAALKGELLSLQVSAHTYRNWAAVMKVLYEEAAKEGYPSNVDSIKIPPASTPVFDANLSKLGLLGSSLAGDIVMAITSARAGIGIKLDKPMANKMAVGVYESLIEVMEILRDDLGHVAGRLQADEDGTGETPSLICFRQAREELKKKKKAKEP